jgi:hypothetical protein
MIIAGGTGVLQAAAAHNNLWGLLFFRRRLYANLFAAVTIIPALAAFFTWNYYNATGVIQGAQQAGLFTLGIVIALVFTLVLSSLLNRTRLPQCGFPREGLDALREETFFRLIRRRFGRSK